MFNAQNSAYGRGITSNLVTEEQRQRFNDGGRVGLKYGSEWLMKLPGAQKAMKWGASKLSKIPGYDKLRGQLTLPGMSGRSTQPGLGLGTGYFGSAKYGTKEVPLAKSLYGKGAGLLTGLKKRIQKSPVSWGVGTGLLGTGAWNIFGGEEEIDTSDDGGPSKFKDEFKFTKKPTKVDPKSDTLDWTDQEKKEKMGQILLKGAQRLVGGARDKWGSKEQMKNIGDWFGDVAAIGDKTELRKDERKYKAMGKAYKEISRDKLASAKEYGNQIAGGATESQALKVSTNGKLRSVQLPRNKKQRDKMVETLVVGDIYFDEGASTNKFFIAGHEDKDGKGIPVPKDQLAEVQALVIQRGA